MSLSTLPENFIQIRNFLRVFLQTNAARNITFLAKIMRAIYMRKKQFTSRFQNMFETNIELEVIFWKKKNNSITIIITGKINWPGCVVSRFGISNHLSPVWSRVRESSSRDNPWGTEGAPCPNICNCWKGDVKKQPNFVECHIFFFVNIYSIQVSLFVEKYSLVQYHVAIISLYANDIFTHTVW